MIAVFGASGTIGSRVLAALLKERADVRALVRSPPKTPDPSMEHVAIDLADLKTVQAALANVEKVFLLTPIGSSQLSVETGVVKIAAQQGVKQIVKLSAMGADAAPVAFANVHGQVEEAIRESGCAWTFLRPNMFMQNLFWYRAALQQGSLPLPLGNAAVSHVDANDIASLAALALLKEGHVGKSYTVTGPEALTGTEVAAILSRVLEKKIEYQPVAINDFRAYLKSTGESDYVVDAEVELFAYWSEGHGREVDPLASSRNTLEQFATRERASLS